mgnify:CR=1 FL=1
MFRKSLFEPTLFDQSVGEFTTETEEYMFNRLSNPINQVRPDGSLGEPRQHQIDPSYNAVVAMQVNHPEFALWCENELHLMGLDDVQIKLYKGLADAALRCIPTPKLLKEMDMYSTITTEE